MKFRQRDQSGTLYFVHYGYKMVPRWCIVMTNKIEVKLRLPKEVKDKLQSEADKQKRSVNNLLEVIIDEYLKNKDK